MCMVFNESDDLNQSGSIFNDPSLQETYPQNDVPPKTSSANGLLNMYETFVEKFIEEPKKKYEHKNLQKYAKNHLAEQEEILKIFYSFGCNIILSEGLISIEYPQLNIVGKITVNGKDAEFDDNAKKIMKHLATLINNSNDFGHIMDNYEQENFYPVGELENEKVKINGVEQNVLAGTLMNKQGETKKVYYYKGKEITPDK